jgi:myo-inositol 2-dehydrogenase / D-chiro-inositol 1-dehydrogenase
MTVNIGVVGTGMIGREHIRRLSTVISGARVTLVTDVAADAAQEVAAAVGAQFVPKAEELVTSDQVDAVVVTSPGPVHPEQLSLVIKAGKPTLCEKPLATTEADARGLLDAELALGRRVVQVGFMRRYDAGYRDVRAAVAGGRIGTPLLMHNVHRNPDVPAHWTSENTINDSVVHEVDTIRWLLGEEITSVQVVPPAPHPDHPGVQDPQFVLFRTASGLLATVEAFVRAAYGYDVRCEVVGTEGTASLVNPVRSSLVSATGEVQAVPASWKDRFEAAFNTEFQEWVDGVAAGAAPTGPSVWDGYANVLVAEAGVRAIATGAVERVDLPAAPELYR